MEEEQRVLKGVGEGLVFDVCAVGCLEFNQWEGHENTRHLKGYNEGLTKI